MSDGPPMLVYVVDDDAMVRNSIRNVLEANHFRTDVFASGAEFLEAARTMPPSCTILDVRMPGMDGLEVLARIKALWPDNSVIMISGHGDIPMAVKALQTGAADFVEKPFQADDLLAVLLKSCEKDNGQPDQEANESALLCGLSLRELQILRLLVRGEQNKGVARILHISSRTVEVHRARIMQRLNVSNFAELVRVAIHEGLKID